MVKDAEAAFDVLVVGGGPAGIAATLWAGRYRRRVALVDAGQHRNRWTRASHGYLGFDGASPFAVVEAARRDLDRYGEVSRFDDRRVVTGRRRRDDTFEFVLDDGRALTALRVVLATGVRDVFPEVERFEEFFGRSIFTCPSCDGYEAQGKAVAVVGDSPEMAEFAIGLLDWASSVVAIREAPQASSLNDQARHTLATDDVIGRVTAIHGDDGAITFLQLDGGATVACDVVFWLMRQEHQSDLPEQLGCELEPNGCIVVDDECATTIEGVYAAGDTTPGPHLVQIAAAGGARAGIAAAVSLRGQSGSGQSPLPAPDPEDLVEPPAA